MNDEIHDLQTLRPYHPNALSSLPVLQMSNWYNEPDPYAAQWLRNLIAAGHIPDGVVDTRSILDVCPADLDGFTQCHFFAGLGGWPYALRLAQWPDSRPVWSGSCPCQPFSVAGRGLGFSDERHLWPYWQWLIKECHPAAVLGEQVAGKAVDPWIDLVHADLESLGYAFGCVPFPSAGVGAPHIRDRTYWVAYDDDEGLQERVGDGRVQPETLGSSKGQAIVCGSDIERVANLHTTSAPRLGTDGRESTAASRIRGGLADSCELGGLADCTNSGLERRRAGETRNGRDATRIESERFCDVGRMGDTNSTGPQQGQHRPQAAGYGRAPVANGVPERLDDTDGVGTKRQGRTQPSAMHRREPNELVVIDMDSGVWAGPTNGFWANADWLGCRDGKWRPVEPGTFPLAHGAASRAGRLRAYGNAINAAQAAIFIETVMEVL